MRNGLATTNGLLLKDFHSHWVLGCERREVSPQALFLVRGGHPVRVVVRNHSSTYQKHTILSTKSVECNGVSHCTWRASPASQTARLRTTFFSADGASQVCMVPRAFVGDSEAGEGHLRRSGTAIGQAATPATKAVASTLIDEREGTKPAIGGCGSRGSDGMRRAANRWQSDGQRRRAVARSKRLRGQHAPAHLLR